MVSRWGAVAIALLMVLGVEVAARMMMSQGLIKLDPSLDRLVKGQRREMIHEKPRVWLVGNSTLHEGVDEAEFEQAFGQPVAKLTHGSASLGGSIAMADYYASTTDVPVETLAIFVAVDDLNVNGYRAKVSRRYFDYSPDPWDDFRELSVAYSASNSIVTLVTDCVDAVIYRKWPPKALKRTEATETEVPEFDGRQLSADDAWQQSLMEDFRFEPEKLREFKAMADRHGIARVILVLVPVTDRHIELREQELGDWHWQTLRDELKREADAAGVELLDFAEPTTNYREFEDSYHLNAHGKSRFTRELAEALR